MKMFLKYYSIENLIDKKQRKPFRIAEIFTIFEFG